MDYQNCTLEVSDSCIVVKENRSKFELKNPQRKIVKKVKVDGCLIDDARERCDWIFSLDTPISRVLYVELKGCDIEKAISQLKATIVHTKDNYIHHNKECYAITTRYPKHDSTTRKYAMDMMQKHQASLYIKNLIISVEA